VGIEGEDVDAGEHRGEVGLSRAVAPNLSERGRSHAHQKARRPGDGQHGADRPVT
jgi:hypothetical protein